ncbi:MAG TPA: FKBP-type peptidyl-prolyl cis-trans isomerase [Flavipsychrobacter sp.]|nr:FKBP-type peptidyl-prolyl cis-trans isomerase [Flavipsychrobacter sp.]
MKKVCLFATAIALCSSAAFAQTKKETKIKTDKTKIKTEGGELKVKGPEGKIKKQAAPGFQITPTGLEYKIVKDVPGTKAPKIGDNVEMHINTHVGDSSLFNSRKLNNNQPVPFTLAAPAFKGDLVEGFMMMTPGDSAVFRVSIDSLQKAGAQLMPWMKGGDMIEYEVVMVSVKSQAEAQKEAAEKSAGQVQLDDSLIQDYLKKNSIKAVKTPSGLYYKINRLGTGLMAAKDQQVTVNYTGKTLDGSIFDSNTDPMFKHVEPFSFLLGAGHVIKGWDEGLTYFNKGATGTLFIPSGLAYGERSPTPSIPANAVLVFDVELLHVETPPVRLEKGGGRSGGHEGHEHGHEHKEGDGHKH